MTYAQELWGRTYESRLSGCTVTISVMSNGALQVTFEDKRSDESWGEEIGSIEALEVAYQIQAHSDNDLWSP